MRLWVGGKVLKMMRRAYSASVRSLTSHDGGNVAMSFAVASMPLCMAIGLEGGTSSSNKFLSASDPDEIEEGLASLFQQYLGALRLTQ